MGDPSKAPDQIISLPSGGGALRGLGETFAPDLQTGTGNLSLPLEVPAGRGGVQPQLSLSYSTGQRMGRWGLGWSLTVPGVSRRTEDGVPRYRGGDTFVLSGAEELVPVQRLPDGSVSYRPRTEGLFAEVVRHGSDGSAPGAQDYWEVRSRDGMVSLYGTPPPAAAPATWRDPAVTADPGPGQWDRIFAWALTLTRDPVGNVIEYEYDTDVGASEGHRWRCPVLRRIRYVNYTADDSSIQFLASIVLESETRPDPYSDYSAGFEIRTALRYKSVGTYVHPGFDQPVRRYDLKYAQDPYNGMSLLTSVEAVGFDDQGTEAHELPAVRFDYRKFEPSARRFRPVTGAELPTSALSSGDYELGDVTGYGLPDIVQLNGTARYWRNLGGGAFDRPRSMPNAPAGLSLSDPGVQLLDAEGNGRADLSVTTGSLAGYFPLRFGPSWGRFNRYRNTLSIDPKDASVQLLDLTGNQVTDAVLGGTRLNCYFNDPDAGWTGPQTARFAPAAAGSPTAPTVLGDPHVRFASMSGGLRDLVQVRNGSVIWWPNLGHGDWGAPVRMTRSPSFPPGYDPARVLIGDLDGDKCADCIYAAGGQVTIWFNRGGNAWSEPVTIQGVPGDVWDVRLTDLLGTGTSGILFTRDARGPGQASMYFLDLTGGVTPRLMSQVDNRLGAVTRISYTSSADLAAMDARRPATRWRTSLPFPVPTVTLVETIDQLSGGKLSTVYKYADGIWAARDKEFRGFAYAERTDTETFEEYHQEGLHPEKMFRPIERAHFSPPVRTCAWFHVGPVETDTDNQWQEVDPILEFWDGDPPRLDQKTILQTILSKLSDRPARYDALRALRGKVIRTELYALDRTPRQHLPYTVTEYAYTLREEPAMQGTGIRRVFYAPETARRTTEWERGDDPLTRYTFTGDHDPFGQPRRRTEIALPRRVARRHPITAAGGTVHPDQVAVLATHTRTSYAAPTGSFYIQDRVAQLLSYELTAPPTVTESDPSDILKVLADQAQAARDIRTTFDALAPGDTKVFAHTVNHYDGPAFTGLPTGQLGPYGLLVRSERLVFTDGVLDGAYGARRPQALGGNEPPPSGSPTGAFDALGYRKEAAGDPYMDGWYADTSAHSFDIQDTTIPAKDRSGFLTAIQDPLGHKTEITPDPYRLFPASVKDAAGLITRATYNYRTGRPEHVVDPNEATTSMYFNGTGLLAAVVFTDRNGRGGTPEKPQTTHTYDFRAFVATGQPVSVHTRTRIWHASEGISDEIIESREYSDGFGRLIQTRTQADDLAFGHDGDDTGLLGPGQAARAKGGRRPDRVTVGGWKTYDNKGRIVETREPFFDEGWDYGTGSEAKQGRKTMQFYDPRGRLEHLLNPDGSQRRIIFGTPAEPTDPAAIAPTPWEQTSYDENDLAPVSSDPDGLSLIGSARVEHHFTPTTTFHDALGRPLRTLTRGGATGSSDRSTAIAYDMSGNAIQLVDELGRTALRYIHDLTSRPMLTESIDAGPVLSITDAAGNPILTTDSRDAATLRTYDGVNRLLSSWARDTAAATLTLRQRITYGDALPPGPDRNTAIAVNAMGRIWVHDDEAGRLSYESYDHAGRILRQSRTAISDEALANGWEPDWESSTAENALEANTLTRETTYDALGRTTDIRSPSGHSISPAYARSGGLQSVAIDGTPFITLQTYNARGQRIFIAYANGIITRYAYYRETFRLARMRSERATPLGDTWTGTGPALQDLSYTYDLVGNVTGIEEHTPGCGVAATASGRDALSRVFAYDAFYRLTSATGRACGDLAVVRPLPDAPRCGAVSAPYNHGPAVPDQSNGPDITTSYLESYAYDAAGNLLDLFYRPTTGLNTMGWHRLFGISGRDPGESAGAPDNRLTKVRNPGSSMSELHYDEAGNLVKDGHSRTYTWNHAGQLVGFTEKAGAGESKLARYLYGADGLRVKKWVRHGGIPSDDESTTYTRDFEERHRWAKGDGESHFLHIFDGTRRVGIIRSGDRHPEDMAPPIRYELADHLGSSSITVDATCKWVNREEYFPYGETSFGSFARKRYRFTGMERDQESGWEYHGARYYVPVFGRWASVDSLAAGAEGDTYAYVKGNPLKHLDTDGSYEQDMHQLGVYFVLRGKGYGPATADRLAGYSQYVDNDFTTEPLRLDLRQLFSSARLPTATRTRVFFHFIGSREDVTTVRNDPRARQRVLDTFSSVQAPNRQVRAQSGIRAGAALHTFFDTFSHEGFTGHHSVKLNTRTGTRVEALRVGHADADEGGHAPDRPYNDVDKAMEALRSLYELIPESRESKVHPWYSMELELRITLSAREPDLNARMQAMNKLIENRFGDKVDIDMSRLGNTGPMYRLWVDQWRWETEKKESSSPPIHLVPLR